jgi:outer membrane protein assembly factor BamB
VRRRARLWPLALILLGIGAAFLWIWEFVGKQRQDRVVASYMVCAIGFLLVVLWILVLSRLPWRTRILGFLVLVAVPLTLGLLLERQGVTGDVVPVLRWRWSGRPAEAAATTAVRTPRGDIAPASVEGDYPQFLGPRRDGTLPDAHLSPDWDATPPRELWRRPIGAGWSAFAVAGRYAVTQEQRGEDEVVSCYDRLTGEPIWTHANHARHEDGLGGPGPRATPTIVNGHVYALGGTGLLDALDLETGASLWSQDILGDTGASRPTYGVSGSPLVHAGQVVVLAGGGAGRSLVAYDEASGTRVWSGGDDPAAYSSPIATTLAGVEQIVVLTQSNVVGHDAATGKRLWAFPWPEGTEKVSQPVVLPEDRLFLSSGYGIGGKLLEVAARDGRIAPHLVWESIALKAKFTNVVHREGYLYGLDDGRLACIDVATGQRRWKGGRYGHGQTILAGDRLLIQAEAGEVALVDASPEAYVERGRIHALRSKTWNHPALAGRHLLVRNDVEAACYELPQTEEERP